MTKLSKPYCIVILMLTVSNHVSAQERREIPDYRTFGIAENGREASQIERLISDYTSSWKTLNTKALISLHAHDTEWTNAFARIFQGSNTLEQFLETRLFPQFERSFSENESLIITPLSLRYLGDDTAVIHLYTEFKDNASDNNEIRRTHFHLVAHQYESTWKIAHTAIMDAR